MRQVGIVLYASGVAVPAHLRKVAIVPDGEANLPVSLRVVDATLYLTPGAVPAGLWPLAGVRYRLGESIPPDLLPIAVLTRAAPYSAANTPALGAELLTNGNFAAWTLDNPDSWTVTGEGLTDPAVHQVGTGEGRLGVGTGFCNIYTTSVAVSISQVVCTVGAFYKYSGTVDLRTAGGLLVVSLEGAYYGSVWASAGAKVGTFRALATTFGILRQGGATDVTIDDVSLKALTLSSLLDLVADTVAGGVYEAALTAPAGYQAGVMAADAVDPANYWLALLDRNPVADRASLVKCVGGTVSNVIAPNTITYVAGARLEVRQRGTTYQLWYNGAQVGSNATITNLPALEYFGGLRTDTGVTVSGVQHYA
mgnify:FL=1